MLFMRVNTNKSICFLMPRPDSGPVGGYKVVYEYANRFAADQRGVHLFTGI